MKIKDLTPAQNSKRIADEIEAQEREKRKRREEAELKAYNAEQKLIEKAAQEKAPKIYAEYRRIIDRCAISGGRSCVIDRQESSSYIYHSVSRSKEEIIQEAILEQAKKIARKMLEKDGYRVDGKSKSWVEEWGGGSDPLPIKEGWASWYVINW